MVHSTDRNKKNVYFITSAVCFHHRLDCEKSTKTQTSIWSGQMVGNCTLWTPQTTLSC